MIGDPSLSNSLSSLDHRRNVGTLCVFYKYYYGRSSDELRELMPQRKGHGRFTRLVEVSHNKLIDQLVCLVRLDCGMDLIVAHFLLNLT